MPWIFENWNFQNRVLTTLNHKVQSNLSIQIRSWIGCRLYWHLIFLPNPSAHTAGLSKREIQGYLKRPQALAWASWLVHLILIWSKIWCYKECSHLCFTSLLLESDMSYSKLYTILCTWFKSEFITSEEQGSMIT